jgi:hypothetical protein
LREYFDQVRENEHPIFPQDAMKQHKADKVLTVLFSYYSDSVSTVRARAYSLARSISVNTPELSIRQRSVQSLIDACRDKDSGNIGSVLSYLTGFSNSDFTSSAKDSLRSLCKSKSPHFDKLIRLVGFLELSDLKPQLQTLSQQSDAPKKDRWAAQLALARMGDQAIIQNIMNRVKQLPVNDESVYQLFPDLIYTRQMEAISYLTRVLFSDENNCQLADDERSSKIPCAYRIMEQLAPVIKGYPLELDKSGDIRAKDYVVALEQVREWFRQQKNYSILKDTY